MRRVFDGRHRWGPVTRQGSVITRVCAACGRVDSAETLLSDQLIDALVDSIQRPNPYRSLVR